MVRKQEYYHYEDSGWKIDGILFGCGTGRTRAISALMSQGFSMAGANRYLNLMIKEFKEQSEQAELGQ